MERMSKTVAVTGCTGGLGRALCFQLAAAGASLIMLDRNPEKSRALAEELQRRFPGLRITGITTELEDMDGVRQVTEQLISLKPDVFIANAGAYHIPRHTCSSGYENVFQINFISPYYMARRLCEGLPAIKIVAVGSIAHTYAVIDEGDVDFSTRKRAALCYGNSKRILMLALAEKYKEEPQRLAIVHPGITVTNITNHYPKVILALIKQPMKVIFMKPQKAVLSIVQGVSQATPYGSWIGPRLFGIWGKPKKQRLRAVFTADSQKAATIAEKIYRTQARHPECAVQNSPDG